MHLPAIPTLSDHLEGSKVFPCIPNGKLPATTTGWKEASDDPAQIAHWHNLIPSCNWAVACGLSGLFVIDIDPSGLLWWKELLMRDQAVRRAVESTFQVKTPRGGLHVYFRGEGPSTAGRIAEGIDTRGGLWRDGSLVSGGYVVLPGSTTDKGSYEVLQNLPILPLPSEVASLVPERTKGEVHGLDKNPDLDQPRNVAWAIDLLKGYVASGRVSEQGKGGNDLAFRVVASILDKAISPGTAYELLLEHWNEHCQPPWDDWELERIVRNASEYSEQGKTGAKGMQSNADAFAGFALPEAQEEPKPAKKLLWLMHEYAAQAQDMTWLIPNFIPSEGVGMLYGKSGSFKTFLALDMASCLAHGIPGQWNCAPVPHDVIYLAGEQPKAMSRQRRSAWAEWQGQSEICNNLYVVDHVPYYHSTAEWEQFKAEIEAAGVKPSLIIIDTLVRLMTGLDENDTKSANLIIDFLEKLARHYNCFVLVLHHTGKDLAKGARGSEVYYANSEVVFETRKQDDGTALHVRKQKEIDQPKDPFLFAKKSFGSSIILERTENLNEAPTASEPKNDWATPENITKLLPPGTEITTKNLASMLASSAGGDHNKICRILRNTESLKGYHDGDNWKLPELEWDL